MVDPDVAVELARVPLAHHRNRLARGGDGHGVVVPVGETEPVDRLVEAPEVASETRASADQVCPPSAEPRCHTFHAAVRLSIQVIVKIPLPLPVAAGALTRATRPPALQALRAAPDIRESVPATSLRFMPSPLREEEVGGAKH